MRITHYKLLLFTIQFSCGIIAVLSAALQPKSISQLERRALDLASISQRVQGCMEGVASLLPKRSDCSIFIKEIAPVLGWDHVRDGLNRCNCCYFRLPLRENLITCDDTHTYITEIHLERKRLRGTLLSAMSKLKKLQKIILHTNLLRGDIPASWGSLTELEVLDLDHNNLNSISLSPMTMQWTQLRTLSLGNNNLAEQDGTFPSILQYMTRLQHLYLSRNELRTTIPSWLSRMTSLRELDLSNNALYGEIPSELGRLTRLVSLSLNSNQLSGELPPALSQLRSLEELFLGFNALSGELPDFISGLTRLIALRLNHNEFTGNIPQSWNRMTNIRTITIHANYLDENLHIPENLHYLINVESQQTSHKARIKAISTELTKDSEQDCAICLENMKVGELVMAGQNCQHQYHEECVSKWVTKARKTDCPMCRQRLLNRK